jgi:Nuclease-related domain
MSRNLVIGLLAAAALLLIALLAIWWRRRRRSTIRDVLAAIAVDHLDDVLVPDGMGGQIHVEHLLLTVRGILVLDVKAYDGIIFASDRMDQWTVIGPRGRSTFPNPLGSLYDRVAAVRQLVRDVEVGGYVVFPALADFSKGRPQDVILPDDLGAAYAKPDPAEVAKLLEAFEPHWERIRAAVQPASD